MKTLSGTIISLKTNRTARVLVTRKWQHPLYKKYVKRTKKYLCDYDKDKIKLENGMNVEIAECSPISKRKHFKVVKVVKK